MSFFNQITQGFKTSGTLAKLLILNISIFLILNLSVHIFRVTFLYENIILYSNGFFGFISHAWGIFTYMFAHIRLGHVFSNLLWLFFMGQIFNAIIGEKRILFVYIFGGLCGGLFYLVSALVFPQLQGTLEGASASVMAIAVAIGFYAPNMPVNVFLFGEVKLKWVVLGSFVAFSIIDFSVNSGGKISHIGGALFGLIYGHQLKNRKDLGEWFTNLFKPRKKSKLKVVHTSRMTDEDYNYNKNQQEKTLDELLDKIHKSGYDSLSKKDKETLHRLSKKP